MPTQQGGNCHRCGKYRSGPKKGKPYNKKHCNPKGLYKRTSKNKSTGKAGKVYRSSKNVQRTHCKTRSDKGIKRGPRTSSPLSPSSPSLSSPIQLLEWIWPSDKKDTKNNQNELVPYTEDKTEEKLKRNEKIRQAAQREKERIEKEAAEKQDKLAKQAEQKRLEEYQQAEEKRKQDEKEAANKQELERVEREHNRKERERREREAKQEEQRLEKERKELIDRMKENERISQADNERKRQEADKEKEAKRKEVADRVEREKQQEHEARERKKQELEARRIEKAREKEAENLRKEEEKIRRQEEDLKREQERLMKLAEAEDAGKKVSYSEYECTQDEGYSVLCPKGTKNADWCYPDAKYCDMPPSKQRADPFLKTLKKGPRVPPTKNKNYRPSDNVD